MPNVNEPVYSLVGDSYLGKIKEYMTVNLNSRREQDSWSPTESTVRMVVFGKSFILKNKKNTFYLQTWVFN